MAPAKIRTPVLPLARAAVPVALRPMVFPWITVSRPPTVDAVLGVPGDEVAAHRIGGTANTPMPVPFGSARQAVGGRADVVALHGVRRSGDSRLDVVEEELDTGLRVAGNDVPRRRRVSADDVERAADGDAVRGWAHAAVPAGVGADAVSAHDVAVRPDQDAAAVVDGADVAAHDVLLDRGCRRRTARCRNRNRRSNRPRIVPPGVSSAARPQSPALPSQLDHRGPGISRLRRAVDDDRLRINVGNPDCGVIVCTPLPGMLNVIVSTSPLSAFDSRIACRNEPAPLSFVLVTTRLRPAGVTVVVSNDRVVAGRRIRRCSDVDARHERQRPAGRPWTRRPGA